MDQQKIGGYIARMRKKKQLTQEQLAELLHVTDKAVSKWETGVCLPDPAKYESLCDILGISISELFAGGRVSQEECMPAAEKNLLEMLERRLYACSGKDITFEEFKHALGRYAVAATYLAGFSSKEEAVAELAEKSGCPAEECAKAYDIYKAMGLGREA